MARPAANDPRSRKAPRAEALDRVPPPPKGLKGKARESYQALGELMVEAGTLSRTSVPMLVATARIEAMLEEMYADPKASRATILGYARVHKEHLVQLGMGASALAGRGGPGESAKARRYRDLLE